MSNRFDMTLFNMNAALGHAVRMLEDKYDVRIRVSHGWEPMSVRAAYQMRLDIHSVEYGIWSGYYHISTQDLMIQERHPLAREVYLLIERDIIHNLTDEGRIRAVMED